MNSVSKINVEIGSNAAQFAAGMGQASSAVGRFTASAGQMNMAVSQLAFAADDVVQVYGQSGVAGALRAASNNISMMAASLFGVKGLMIAVAASAATQLVMSFSKTKDAAKGAADGIDELVSAQRRKIEQDRAMSQARAPAMGIPLTAQRSTVQAAIDEQERLRQEVRNKRGFIKGLELERTELLRNPRAFEQRTEEESAKRKKLVEELDSQLKTERDRLEVLQEELKTQERITYAIKQRSAVVAPGVPGDRFGFFGEGAAAQGIRARLSLAAAQQRAFDPMRFFSRLPGAQTFGSSGAVSTINQAMIGPKNVENAQLAELKTIARSTSDAARILGGKLPVAVEVRL